MLLSERIHIVLVEPGESLNIGSVARAMKNLGFKNLHLVAPPRFDLARATMTACWAEDILAGAIHHQSIEEALATMDDVVGFSSEEGKNKPPIAVLPEWCSSLSEFPAQRIGVLFGPEDTGLTLEHLRHCRAMVRIPSRAECPSFNLSQAVMLALYELSKLERAPQLDAGDSGRSVEPLAEWAQFAQLDKLITDVCEYSGFYTEGTPAPLPQVVQNLCRRMTPTRREMQMLLGIFGSVRATFSGQRPLHALRSQGAGVRDAKSTNEE